MRHHLEKHDEVPERRERLRQDIEDLTHARDSLILARDRVRAFYAVAFAKFGNHLGTTPLRPSVATVYREDPDDDRTAKILRPRDLSAADGHPDASHTTLAALCAKQPDLLLQQEEDSRPRRRRGHDSLLYAAELPEDHTRGGPARVQSLLAQRTAADGRQDNENGAQMNESETTTL